jgi:hypothetical protein
MALEDRIDAFPEPWKPAPGDKLIGTVVEVGERASDFGGSYPIVTVLADDGREVTFHAFHTVAKAELARQRPAVGDRLAVKYFGRDEERGYERYRVLVEKAVATPATPDWDKMAAEAAEEAAEDAGELPLPEASDG